jgi:hypothetical protein
MLTTNPRKDLTTTIATLIEAAQHIQHALDELYDSQPGYPSATGGAGTPTLTDSGNPPGLEKHLRTDPAHEAHRDLLELITTTKSNATRIHRIVTIWTAEATAEGSPRNNPADCITCGATVTKPQRIRAGLCEPCYRHWARARHTTPDIDRHTWIGIRRSQLAGDMVTTRDAR